MWGLPAKDQPWNLVEWNISKRWKKELHWSLNCSCGIKIPCFGSNQALWKELPLLHRIACLERFIWKSGKSLFSEKKYLAYNNIVPQRPRSRHNSFSLLYFTQSSELHFPFCPQQNCHQLKQELSTLWVKLSIAPFHFFDNFNFHHKITFITR